MRRPFLLAIPVIAIAGLALGIVPASASPAIPHQAVTNSRPQVTPRHAVTCDSEANEPYQFGRGAPIGYDAHLICSPLPPPDICSTTVVLWRQDTDNDQWYEEANVASSRCSGDWYVPGTFNCGKKVGYWFHTEVTMDFFHGNWNRTHDNSNNVFLYC